MTETPILTKKQQKSSLSAKKTKTKETIRNVLATPYNKYWPLILDEHVALVHEVLSKHLPRILPEKGRISWKQLKEVPRSERKLFRRAQLKEKPCEPRQGINRERDGLVFGVNDTTRAIEKGIVKSVLIAEDVQPKLMVEHLIDQSVLLRIPVLVVPGLRDLLRNSCGVSSIAVAFTDSTKYETVKELIQNVYENYPVPRDHINFQRSLDLANSSVILIEDSVLEEITVSDEPKKPQCCSPGNSLDLTTSIEECIVESDKVYLYRKTKAQRTFVPERSGDRVKDSGQMHVDSTGFLSFSVDSSVDSSAKVINSVIKEYNSLKVKKIKGDVNRNKRKIGELKHKLKQKKDKNNVKEPSDP